MARKGKFTDIFKEPKKKKKRTDEEIIADNEVPKGFPGWDVWWSVITGEAEKDIDDVYKDREGMVPDLPKVPDIKKDIIPLALVGILLFFVIKD